MRTLRTCGLVVIPMTVLTPVVRSAQLRYLCPELSLRQMRTESALHPLVLAQCGHVGWNGATDGDH